MHAERANVRAARVESGWISGADDRTTARHEGNSVVAGVGDGVIQSGKLVAYDIQYAGENGLSSRSHLLSCFPMNLERPFAVCDSLARLPRAINSPSTPPTLIVITLR